MLPGTVLLFTWYQVTCEFYILSVFNWNLQVQSMSQIHLSIQAISIKWVNLNKLTNINTEEFRASLKYLDLFSL